MVQALFIHAKGHHKSLVVKLNEERNIYMGRPTRQRPRLVSHCGSYLAPLQIGVSEDHRSLQSSEGARWFGYDQGWSELRRTSCSSALVAQSMSVRTGRLQMADK